MGDIAPGPECRREREGWVTFELNSKSPICPSRTRQGLEQRLCLEEVTSWCWLRLQRVTSYLAELLCLCCPLLAGGRCLHHACLHSAAAHHCTVLAHNAMHAHAHAHARTCAHLHRAGGARIDLGRDIRRHRRGARQDPVHVRPAVVDGAPVVVSGGERREGVARAATAPGDVAGRHASPSAAHRIAGLCTVRSPSRCASCTGPSGRSVSALCAYIDV